MPNIIEGTVEKLRPLLEDELGGKIDEASGKFGEITRAAEEAREKLIGGSIVPVTRGIEAHFARLDEIMVAPAERAMGAMAVDSAY